MMLAFLDLNETIPSSRVRSSFLNRSPSKLVLTTFLVTVTLGGASFAAEFIPLGDLPGGEFFSTARAVSLDGSTVIGESDARFDNEGFPKRATSKPIRWNAVEGLQLVVDEYGFTMDLSQDGSVVTHWYRDDDGVAQFIRLSGEELTSLGFQGLAVSPDGNTIMGMGEKDWDEKYRWTAAGGTERLNLPFPIGAESSYVNEVSNDGESFFGNLLEYPGGEPQHLTYLRTPENGLQILPEFEMGQAENPDAIQSIFGYAASDDFQFVVGQAWLDGESQTAHAFRWSAQGGMEDLGVLAGSDGSRARGVSRDGSIVIGTAGDNACGNCPDPEFAFIWDEQQGMRDLRTVLMSEYDLANELTNWQLEFANSISADGTVIVGDGINPDGHREGWIVDLAAMEGDLDRDRTIDAADIDLLSRRIRDGNATDRFDLDSSGIIDAADRDFWVHTIAKAWFGDANLDGEFGSGDLVVVFEAGKYETDQVAMWSEGDWNGDGIFSTTDLVVAFEDGGYEQGPQTALVVPEPSGTSLAAIAIALAMGRIGCSRRGGSMPARC